MSDDESGPSVVKMLACEPWQSPNGECGWQAKMRAFFPSDAWGETKRIKDFAVKKPGNVSRQEFFKAMGFQ